MFIEEAADVIVENQQRWKRLQLEGQAGTDRDMQLNAGLRGGWTEKGRLGHA